MAYKYPQISHVRCCGVFSRAATSSDDGFLYGICIHRGHIFRINADNTIGKADSEDRAYIERYHADDLRDSLTA